MSFAANNSLSAIQLDFQLAIFYSADARGSAPWRRSYNMADPPEREGTDLSAAQLRALEIRTGADKVFMVCNTIKTVAISSSTAVGLYFIAKMLLDEGARAFLGPMGWWLLALALPSTGIVPMARAYLARASKTTRRTKTLESMIDPGRTSSLPSGEDDEEKP